MSTPFIPIKPSQLQSAYKSAQPNSFVINSSQGLTITFRQPTIIKYINRKYQIQQITIIKHLSEPFLLATISSGRIIFLRFYTTSFYRNYLIPFDFILHHFSESFSFGIISLTRTIFLALYQITC